MTSLQEHNEYDEEAEAEAARRRDTLIREAISFMQVIIEEYGEEKGEQMWDTIVTTLDPSVKRQILMLLLTGNYSAKIILRGFRGQPQKVTAIKAVRVAAGLSLKEAKHIIDTAYGDIDRDKDYHPYEVTKGTPVEIEVDPAKRKGIINDLELAGILI